MATVSRAHSELDKLSWYMKRGHHAQWDRFSPDQQAQMVRDDLFAGRSVSLVLSSLIAAGLVLSALTLALILATG